MSEETVKTRDKQIKQAAYGWACSEETGYLGSNSFVQGALWADSNPAPGGKDYDRLEQAYKVLRETLCAVKTMVEEMPNNSGGYYGCDCKADLKDDLNRGPKFTGRNWFDDALSKADAILNGGGE